MSSRETYANAAAVLTDWIAEQGGDVAAVDFIAAWLSAPKKTEESDGGFHNNSMQALCSEYSLNWGLLAAWIRKDPGRDGRFRQALVDRGALRKERLLDGWWRTADAVVVDAVTHGDVHKAREALAKAEGVFEGGKAVTINQGGDGTPRSITVTFVDAVDGKPA